MLNFRKYLPFLILYSLFYTDLVIANLSELTDQQKSILETLPPDQRDGIMIKMQTAQGLQEEIEETFDLENSINLNCIMSKACR